jgi:flavin reductase (DIM6/NTAB) family NADH-FMN oxidoreductase RutF
MAMDPNFRKKALRGLTYGLYVVTSRRGEECAASAVTWLAQCSMEPPLVMVGIQQGSTLHAAIQGSRTFAVHIVGKSQKQLAMSFFKTTRHEGERLNGYRFEEGETGAPVLADAPAWFECRVAEEVRRGDHTVFVAEVVAAGTRGDEEPLTLREAGFSYGG